METLVHTVVGVLIAQKLAFVYKIWRICSRYRSVDAYFQHVRLASRSSQRLALYAEGHRRPKPSNSRTTAWHILVVTPKEAEVTIRTHCNYILKHEGRMSVFADEAGFDTRRLISEIRDICEHGDFSNSNECDVLHGKLFELSGRMKNVKTFHEKERRRITGENYLTMLISKPFMWQRRISGYRPA